MDNHRQANSLDLIPNITEAAERAPSLYDFGRHLAYGQPGVCNRSSHSNQPCENSGALPPDEGVREAEKVRELAHGNGMVMPSPELMKELLAREGKLPPDGKVPLPYTAQHGEYTYNQNAGSLVLNSQAFDYLNPQAHGALSLGTMPHQFQFDSPPKHGGCAVRTPLPFKRYIGQNGLLNHGQTNGDSRYEPVLRVPMNSVPSCIRYRLFGDI